MHSDQNILIYLMVYLSAMVVVVPLAKRLGLGVVLGYLLAGVALGPYGFGIAGEDQTISLLAELGVVLMLFTIGLELDLQKLWSMRKQVFGYGTMQMLVCGLVLAIGVMALDLAPIPALIIGLTLALSSTAVAVQLMNDRNLMATPTGRTAFGILLFQDMAAIPLLIGTSILFPSPNAPSFQPLAALAAIALVIFIGRFLIGTALRLIAQYGSNELFVGAALLIVIGVMELMSMVGVSAGLGAFIAGVLLASSEFRHELEADLNPFRGLFLGLFFITIGSSIDLTLFAQYWYQILGLLLAFMVSKFFLLYLQGWILGMGRKERIALGTLLGQGSEFGFVLSGLAVAGAMVSAREGAWLNLVMALSIAVSSLFMRLQDWYATVFLSRSLKKQAMDTEMEQTPVIIAGFGRYGQIVGRLLAANHIRSTILDYDSEQIESMRRFGYKVYYGDATRIDLLEVAGAKKAKILVVAVDDPEQTNEIVEMARKHFPHLYIMARAFDVPHIDTLKKLGADVAQRELFEGSLSLGKDALVKLGSGHYEAYEAVGKFRQKNYELIEEFTKLRNEADPKDFAKAVRKRTEELARQLTEEAKRNESFHHPWREHQKRSESARSKKGS